MRNFGDVEWRKNVLKEEPGNESSGTGAAQPDVRKTQDRKILPERVVGPADAPHASAPFRLLYELPNQKAHEDPGDTRHEKPPAPSKPRSHLRGQDRSRGKADQGRRADHQANVATSPPRR